MSEIRHTPIALRLKEPLLTARGAISIRRGFLAGLEHENKKYVSEISLLPEFGTEHFEHAERVLNNETLLLASAPATVYGLDCLRYACQQKSDHAVQVPISKLLSGGSLERILDDVARDIVAGFNTFKLKVGFRDFEEDLTIVNSLFITWPDIKLRLDANLNWSPQHVRTLSERPAAMAVEWVEDPFRATIDEWHTLQTETGIPLASDEAFSERELLDHSGALGFTAAVLKPARMGAISGHDELYHRLRNENVQIIFSSMFDSSVGIAYLAHLAVEWGPPDVAHGLGTLDLLAMDTTQMRLKIDNGNLHAPPLHELASLLQTKYARALGF